MIISFIFSVVFFTIPLTFWLSNSSLQSCHCQSLRNLFTWTLGWSHIPRRWKSKSRTPDRLISHIKDNDYITLKLKPSPILISVTEKSDIEPFAYIASTSHCSVLEQFQQCEIKWSASHPLTCMWASLVAVLLLPTALNHCGKKKVWCETWYFQSNELVCSSNALLNFNIPVNRAAWHWGRALPKLNSSSTDTELLN